MRSVHNRSAGFTILELLVVMAIIGIIALVGLPALQNFIVRSKHEGAARQIATMMHLARMEAVKQSVSTVLWVDTTNKTCRAFADVNADGDFAFDPDPAANYRTTDYQIGGILTLPSSITFEAPGAESVVDSFFDVTWSPTNVAVFEPDGSVRSIGAFRTADPGGNFLEVRIAPQATARVRVRKWDGTAFVAQGEGGTTWEWTR